MKKITCIQQYVIDNLIEDEILSTNSLLGAISKVCSKEQFDNILSILIETPIPCTDVPKLERKEDSGNKTNLVRMSMFIPEETNTSAKLNIIKILKNNSTLVLTKLKNMQIVAQENIVYYPILFYKRICGAYIQTMYDNSCKCYYII